VRYRFDLETTTGIESRTELCEECRLLGLIGAPEQAESFVSLVTQVMAALLPRIEAEGEAGEESLSAAPQRVRSASRRKGVRTRVQGAHAGGYPWGLRPDSRVRRPGMRGARHNGFLAVRAERLGEAITRCWNRMRGEWARFRDARKSAGAAEAATGLPRERLLLPLFQELGYGRLQPARGLEVQAKSYPEIELAVAPPALITA
jgi:hypothetical protein